MSVYKVTDAELTGVANAIRQKGGTQALLEWPNGFVSAVGNISSGGATVHRATKVAGSGIVLYEFDTNVENCVCYFQNVDLVQRNIQASLNFAEPFISDRYATQIDYGQFMGGGFKFTQEHVPTSQYPEYMYAVEII